VSEGSNPSPVARPVVAFATLGLLAILIVPLGPAQAAPNSLFFKETGHTVAGPLLDYWRGNGQVNLLGYPIAPPMPQADGSTLQYFERARLEQQANGAVKPGLLGSELTSGHSFAKVAAFKNRSDSVYFVQSGHSLSRRFLAYWQANGGLTRFGYPLSEPDDATGKVVQWFERARFEWDAKQEKVNLGLLGLERLYPEQHPVLFSRVVAAAAPAQKVAQPARPTPTSRGGERPTAKWEADPAAIGMSWSGWCTYFDTDWSTLIRLNKGWGNLPADYRGSGMYAALPEDITEKYRLYGHTVRISYGGKHVDAQLVDVIAYRDIASVRRKGIVVDLSRQVFAQLAPLSKGMLQLTVEVLP